MNSHCTASIAIGVQGAVEALGFITVKFPLLVIALFVVACNPAAQKVKAPASIESVTSIENIFGRDQLGRQVSIEESLSRGPTAVIFYRGHW